MDAVNCLKVSKRNDRGFLGHQLILPIAKSQFLMSCTILKMAILLFSILEIGDSSNVEVYVGHVHR